MTSVLVTGATGDVGRHVVDELGRHDVPVRALVRDAEKARAIHGDAADLSVGDLGDVGAIRRALEGMERVFLACSNDPRQVEYETNVIDAAAEAGVERVVKLSAVGAEIGSTLDFWDAHGQIERHLRASGLSSVLLRPTSYMTKLLGPPGAIKQSGKLFAPAGDARIALIDPRDVAAVAATTLIDEGHEGQTYVLSGPEAVTLTEVAEALSAAAGRTIEFVDVPEEGARQGMLGSGLPDWLVENLMTLWRFIREGRVSTVTDAVRQVTGREPRTFADFAEDNAALFG